MNPINMFNACIRIFLFSTFIITLLNNGNLAHSQVASPIQGGHYAPGIINIRDMANPPPGMFLLWYNFGFTSDSYFDRNGDEFNGINLSSFDPNLPNVEVSTELGGFGTKPVVFWASQEIPQLGNAKYLAGISANYLTADVSVITESNGNILDTLLRGEIESTVSGFSDFMFVPLGLSWAIGSFDLTFMYSVYAPTGEYETGSAENIGLGFWTHQFQGFSYFYPVENKSTAFMLGLNYETNSEIEDVIVKPGDRFSIEYGVSQFLNEKFEIGIHGGHNFQVSDDDGDDVYWDASVRDQKSLLAFNASYWPISKMLMLNLKYGFDYAAQQRFKNNTFVFNVVYIPNILPKTKPE